LFVPEQLPERTYRSSRNFESGGVFPSCTGNPKSSGDLGKDRFGGIDNGILTQAALLRHTIVMLEPIEMATELNDSAMSGASEHAGEAIRSMFPAQSPAAAKKAEEEQRARDKENQEDLILFRAFVAGSREAYTELYLKYRQRVYAYCLRVVCSDADAQDLFQEVFVRVYERSNQFSEERSLGGWIFTIAHNLCLNRLRDRKPQEPIEDAGLVAEPIEDLGDNWQARIQWALEQIPIEYREAFVLREYEGMTYQEIAVILKTTLPAVKSRIYRSKEKLRELLEPYYHDKEV
jgi:RNA polymerase sigma-70 factor (ECF subfamily)